MNIKWYEMVLRPKSRFRTLLRGDIFFGHVCCQVAQDSRLFEGGIEALVSRYHVSPALVCSSPVYRLGSLLYAPSPPTLSPFSSPPLRVGKAQRYVAPSGESFQDFISCSWEKGIVVDNYSFLSQKRIAPVQTHRDRDGLIFSYAREVEIVLLIALDSEQFPFRSCVSALERIGAYGYGGGSSRGYGRFIVGEVNEVTLAPILSGSWVATLAPSCISDSLLGSRAGYSLIHQGWHGGSETFSVSAKKSPLRLLREGCLGRYLGDERSTGILGEAITEHVSTAHEGKTIHQGYTPVLPLTTSLSAIKEEDSTEPHSLSEAGDTEGNMTL